MRELSMEDFPTFSSPHSTTLIDRILQIRKPDKNSTKQASSDEITKRPCFLPNRSDRKDGAGIERQSTSEKHPQSRLEHE